MADRGLPVSLRTHENYRRLAQIADESHARGRTPEGILERDIALARLYSHAFRGHVIGAFPRDPAGAQPD